MHLSVRAFPEKFVTTSSVENVLVSTTTGSVAPVIAVEGLAGTGPARETPRL